MRSTDAGSTWANLGGANDLRTVRLYPGCPDTVFIAGYSGVVISTDCGQHWASFNSGLGINQVNCLEFSVTDGVNLIAGTNGRACYKYSFETGIESNQAVTTPDLGLEVRPRPAGRSLEIESQVLAGQRCRLRLLDVSGRQVWSRAARFQGSRLRVETEALPAGVYLLEVSARGRAERLQVVLSR